MAKRRRVDADASVYMCDKEELCLFKPVPQQKDILHSNVVVLQSSVAMDNPSYIQFQRNGTNQFIDLVATKLMLSFKVTKKDGSTIPSDTKVYPIQALQATLFKNMEVYFNNQIVEAGNSYDAFTSHLDYYLQYGAQSKKNQLKCIGYGTIAERKILVAESKEVHLFGPLCADIVTATKGRLLLPKVDLRITLYRHEDNFVLIKEDATDYVLKITGCELHLRTVEICPEKMKEIDGHLNKYGAIYPIIRRQGAGFSIPTGSQRVSHTGLFPSQMPRSVFCVFVDSDAANGSMTKDPFKYENFGITKLALKKGGMDLIGPPYTPDFSLGNNTGIVRELYSLFETLGKAGFDLDTGINLEAYKTSPVFAYNLAPDLDQHEIMQPFESGNLTVDVEFKEATKKPITLIMIAFYDAVIRINKDGQIKTITNI